MFRLSINAATEYVRKSLDELESSEDIGLMVDHDDLDLQKLVERHIVEAVIKTHSQVQPQWLEGIKGKKGVDYEIEADEDVATVTMLLPTLRVISMQMSDSDIIVTEFFTEASPEGRMQLNPYIRGRYDSPKAILQQTWAGEHKPVIKYYSLEDGLKDVTLDIEYFPYPEIIDEGVKISSRLEYPVLCTIVAMVLESLSEFDKAEIYKKKAQEYIV